MINFFRDWLGEKSTWVGLFAVIAAFNIHVFTPEQQAAIAVVGTSLVARHEQRGGVSG